MNNETFNYTHDADMNRFHVTYELADECRLVLTVPWNRDEGTQALRCRLELFLESRRKAFDLIVRAIDL